MPMRPAVLIAASIFMAACGSGSAPPPVTPAGTTPQAGGSDPPAAGKPSLSDMRREFVNACNSKVVAPDYCECSWDQMQKTFSEAEMTGPALDPARMAQFKDRTKAACASKLPEDLVKAGFVEGCAGDIPDLKPYCECAWTSYRTRLSVADLANDDVKKTPQFEETMKVAVKTCGQKAQEAPTKARFLKDCGANPALQPFCACGWAELRKTHSPAEVLAGTFSMDSVRSRLDKACGALRPAPAQ
jgi:hypothetical protein